jgi:ABC-type sulfate transport system substrate-binding protein
LRVPLASTTSSTTATGGSAFMESDGTTMSNLSAPSSSRARNASFSQASRTSPISRWAKVVVEPPVAVVDEVVDAKGTRKVAEAYLNFLYTPEAQKLIAHNYYRPSDPKSADPKDLARFVDVKLISIDDPLFGGWAKAQPKHFADGGIFDQIYQPKSTN